MENKWRPWLISYFQLYGNIPSPIVLWSNSLHFTINSFLFIYFLLLHVNNYLNKVDTSVDLNSDVTLDV